MISFGKKIIKASVSDILYKFREYAQERGINVFQAIKPEGENLLVTCPNREHKDMQERTPSCRIANRDIVSKGVTVKEGTVHCFSCGYKAHLESALSQVFGKNDGGEWGKSWLLNNFDSELDTTRDIGIILARGEEPQGSGEEETSDVKKNPSKYYLTDADLDQFRYVHPYWQKRKIDEATMIKFDLGYDRENRCITMPVWDIQGNCVGVAMRSVDSKRFILTDGVDKPIYLLNFAVKEGWNEIYLCESQINALYMQSLGYHACACFGTGSEEHAEILNKSGIRSIVFCFDGDYAGRNGRYKMYKMLSKRIMCSYIDLPEGKDVNDLSPEEIRNLVEHQKLF